MAFCFPQVADELYEYLGVILGLWKEKFAADGVSFKKYQIIDPAKKRFIL